MVDVIQVENPKLDQYRDTLQEFLKNTRCEFPGPFTKRGSHSLIRREQEYPYDVTGKILLVLLTNSAGSSMLDLMQEIWNKAMGDKYSNMHFPGLREYAQSLHSWKSRGPIEVAQKMMCSVNHWNSRASKDEAKKTIVCADIPCPGEECEIDQLPTLGVLRS
jgi:hypothetical protein